jgi:hypothetical protein
LYPFCACTDRQIIAAKLTMKIDNFANFIVIFFIERLLVAHNFYDW